MSEVEETLARLKDIPEIKNFFIVNYQGNIVRIKHDKSKKEAAEIGNALTILTKKAKSFVRDLEPTNDLTFMRVGTKTFEIMIAPDREFILVVIQSLTREAEFDRD
jgi:dynein light chain roadblock-type